MKNILSSGLFLLAVLAGLQAQEVDEIIVNDAGIERILVEKNVVTDAPAIANAPELNGCIAYRIFLDMEPGYKLSGFGGYEPPGLLSIESTSAEGFYNNETFGAQTGASIISQVVSLYPELEYDSYLTDGRIGTSHVGVPKSVDPTGKTEGGVNPQDMLYNALVPLEVVEVNGAVSAIDRVNVGVVMPGGWGGPDPETNILYIAQLTTPGELYFELNFGTSYMGSSSIYSFNHIYSSTATYPIVNLTNPADGSTGLTGESIALSATATDSDGSITKVEFFVREPGELDYTSIGIDNTTPFQVNWTPENKGEHLFKAVATDNGEFSTASAVSSVNVLPDGVPVVSIVSPATDDDTIKAGIPFAIETEPSAAHYGGTIESVEFDIQMLPTSTIPPQDTVFTSPFDLSWVPDSAGRYRIRVVARDILGVASDADQKYIVVADDIPVVSIISPHNADTVLRNTAFTILAEASTEDYEGTIEEVEFFVAPPGSEFASIGVVSTSPYQYNYTPTVLGRHKIKVAATDNFGATAEDEIWGVVVVEPVGVIGISVDKELSFTLYPNPSSDFIHLVIDCFDPVQTISFTVFDILGNKVMHFNPVKGQTHYDEKMDITGLNNGLYIIRFKIDGSDYISKFIKN
jgi:hypothetical protein